jgi:LPXTG-motif cell wall-anchored protein
MGGCSSCSGGVGEYFSANGVGEYFSANGVGEYFSANGVGEYFAANGLGESADSSTVVQPVVEESSNMGLIIGGVALAAVAGFLLLKKKK